MAHVRIILLYYWIIIIDAFMCPSHGEDNLNAFIFSILLIYCLYIYSIYAPPISSTLRSQPTQALT